MGSYSISVDKTKQKNHEKIHYHLLLSTLSIPLASCNSYTRFQPLRLNSSKWITLNLIRNFRSMFSSTICLCFKTSLRAKVWFAWKWTCRWKSFSHFAPRLVLKQRQRVTRKWPIKMASIIYETKKCLTDTEVNNCFSIYHTSFLNNEPKHYFQ